MSGDADNERSGVEIGLPVRSGDVGPSSEWATPELPRVCSAEASLRASTEAGGATQDTGLTTGGVSCGRDKRFGILTLPWDEGRSKELIDITVLLLPTMVISLLVALMVTEGVVDTEKGNVV